MIKLAKDKINWIKASIFILLLLFLIVGNGYLYFRFFMGGSFNSREKIPPHIQTTINSVVERTPIIVGVQVVKVDLKKNVRYVVYYSIKDPNVKKLYSSFISDNITVEVPVFTKNNVQNSKILSLINHEYICYPFIETISYELAPEMAKYITTVCSSTIPMDTGKFVGFVAVFLSREPTATEKDLIRIESLIISQEAYEVIK